MPTTLVRAHSDFDTFRRLFIPGQNIFEVAYIFRLRFKDRFCI